MSHCSEYDLMRPSLPGEYLVRPPISIRGDQGSLISPIILHFAVTSPVSSSLISRRTQFLCSFGTSTSIIGVKLRMLDWNLDRPSKEIVGSVKVQSSSYNSRSMLPDHKYCLSSKSARMPSNNCLDSIFSNFRGGISGASPPTRPFTRPVRPAAFILIYGCWLGHALCPIKNWKSLFIRIWFHTCLIDIQVSVYNRFCPWWWRFIAGTLWLCQSPQACPGNKCYQVMRCCDEVTCHK